MDVRCEGTTVLAAWGEGDGEGNILLLLVSTFSLTFTFSLLLPIYFFLSSHYLDLLSLLRKTIQNDPQVISSLHVG